MRVGLDDEVEHVELSECDAVGYLFEREGLRCAEALLALQLQAFVCYLACLLLSLHDVERVSG